MKPTTEATKIVRYTEDFVILSFVKSWFHYIYPTCRSVTPHLSSRNSIRVLARFLTGVIIRSLFQIQFQLIQEIHSGRIVNVLWLEGRAEKPWLRIEKTESREMCLTFFPLLTAHSHRLEEKVPCGTVRLLFFF